MILEILSVILVLVGIFFIVKPNNFLLPYLQFGGVVNAKNYIKEKGKTKGLILWMRIFGIVLVIVGILFLLSLLRII